MTAKEQNKLAGIFILIHGGVYLLFMLVLGLFYGGIGLALFSTARRDDEQFAGAAFVIMMVVLIGVALATALPQLIGGWKMIKERPNARTWGIIGSIIACLSFPLGTAAGVFGLVFLFGEAGRQFYLASGSPTKYPPQPPPPSSWQ